MDTELLIQLLLNAVSGPGTQQITYWILLLINSHSGECTELAHYKLRKGKKEINKSSDGKTEDWEAV